MIRKDGKKSRNGWETMSEQISIVIPVYNVEKYLDNCIKSLQEQVCPMWQAILVDDGSTDNSGIICDEWAEKDKRIVVLHQKNKGVSAARNSGIAAAQGEYLTFVDADDRIHPRYLQVLKESMGDCDLSVCGVNDGNEGKEVLPQEVCEVKLLRRTPSRYAKLPYINYVYNKMYRTDIIKQNKLQFPEGMHRGEDALFVLAYLCCCQKISVVSENLYDYLQHDGSAMHKFYAGVCGDELQLMKKQDSFFHPEGANSLTKQEEEAFRFWQHGKVLSILRYIANYAPDFSTKVELLQQLLKPKAIQNIFFVPPKQVGLKARIAAMLFRSGLYRPLFGILKRL